MVPTSEFEGVRWRYTTEEPDADWAALESDASEWAEGIGGFGIADSPTAIVRTEWAEPQVWLRHEFTLENPQLNAPFLRVHHIGDVELYLNGEQIIRLPLSTDDYVEVRFPDSAFSLLREGKNVLAVHALKPSFGPPPAGGIKQYIDVGLFDILSTSS